MPRKKQRPFFSIIIPCYNDGRYAPKVYLDRLLSSILKQGLKKSEYEVIISDDHSIIPYKETLDKYARRIAIKYIETDYNFAPGNTRQKGVSVAEGEWICFADHDDIFYPQALSRVRAAIKSSGEQYIVYSNFDKVDSCTSKLLEVFRGASLSTWVHGKFYNLDNLWKPYNLHFIKDLKTHEDLALGKYVECVLHKLNRDPYYFNECTYMWCYSEDSVSHGTYLDIADEFGYKHNFLETHFNDFLISQIEPFFEAYKEGYMTRNELIPMFLSSFSSAYLSFCSFRVANPQGYIKQNQVYCSQFWHRFKQLADIKLVSIKVILRSTFRDKLKELDAKTKSWMLPTLIEWLSQIDEMDSSLELTDDTKTNTSILLKCQDEGQNSLTRPFFSIIIPCYNDGRYQEGKYLDRLLSSIARQDFPKSQVEVILADDCSPIPFDNIVNKWSERLMIKYIKTDYNFAPGNTRAKGLTIATGEWLAFADHDDIYYPEAFLKIKNGILEKNEKHFIFGDFNGVDETGKILRTYECHLNWCHAKFYNKDNLWDKYNIHFIHDLKSHEDIASYCRNFFLHPELLEKIRIKTKALTHNESLHQIDEIIEFSQKI